MKTIEQTQHLIERFIERAEGITEAEARAKYSSMSTKQHDKIFTMLLKAIKRSTEKHVRTSNGGVVLESIIVKTNYNKRTQVFGIGISPHKYDTEKLRCPTILTQEMIDDNLKTCASNIPSTEYSDYAAYTLAK